MKHFMRKSKGFNYIIGGLTLLFLFAMNFGPLGVHAASLYKDGPPLDTDLDGLTDQGEITIFKTDPLNPDTDGDNYLDGAEVLVGTSPIDKNDPIKVVAQVVPTQQKAVPWIWYLTRVSGVVSYLLLFLLLMTGMGITSGFLFNLFGPVHAWRIHRTIGISLVLFIAIHLISLALDKFMSLSIADLLIPFHSAFKPLYLSLGIIGFYLLVLIILTSIIIIISKYRAWRLIHYLTFPAFAILFFHGVYIGTDSSTLIMQITYWTTGVLVMMAFFYRLTKASSRNTIIKKN